MFGEIEQNIIDRILQNDDIIHAKDEIERAMRSSRPPVPPIPQWLPSIASSIPRKVIQVQQFINQFEYNYTGLVFFATKRNRGMKHLVYTAKLIMKEALPIKCVESVFLGVHLTNGIKSVRTVVLMFRRLAPPKNALSSCHRVQLLRLPLSFKSKVLGNEHDHIVMAVHDGLHWGAIGISRLEKLMYKKLTFTSLHSLVNEFIDSYRQYRHEVTLISVGLPFSHDDCSETPIQWKVLNFSIVENISMANTAYALDRYTRDCSFIFEYFSRTGRFPDWYAKEYGQYTSQTKNK